MSVRTAMIDTWLDPVMLKNPETKVSAVKASEELLSSLGLEQRHVLQLIDCDVYLYTAESKCLTCIMHIYSSGLVTITIEDSNTNSPLTNQVLEELKKKLKRSLESHIERIPLVKRGAAVPNYYTTSDERILEYDFDKIVFEADSKYQHVKILHSPSLGNCLILDDLQNLGEKDLSYTHALMNHDKVCYADKEILILGGGDGALLYELLKEKPKYVTMVDIDQMVLDACKLHLRGACGNVLDTLKGENYEVIVDDCIKKMQEYIKEGRIFDCVFNDLTDIPISTEPQGELWDFVRKIVTMGLQLLRKGGLFLNHAIGVSCPKALETYENLLRSLPVKVEFSKHSTHVPSFMEEWVFYEVRKLE